MTPVYQECSPKYIYDPFFLYPLEFIFQEIYKQKTILFSSDTPKVPGKNFPYKLSSENVSVKEESQRMRSLRADSEWTVFLVTPGSWGFAGP